MQDYKYYLTKYQKWYFRTLTIRCIFRSRKYDRIETEYVSDEEDITWLEKVNQVRASFKFNEIPTSLFEQMMGTMEAESYFEVVTLS